MSKAGILVLVLLAASLPAPVMAVGLGQLAVTSTLGQPFDARIPIFGVSESKLDSLSARLGSASLFRKAGIDPTPYLYTLRFNIITKDKRHPYIHVTSRTPLKEPSLEFLVEVQTGSSTLVHHCVALFDPPAEH